MSLPEDDKLKSSNGKMTKEPNGTTSNPATYDPTMHEEIIREFSTLRTSLEKLEKCVRKSMPLKVNDGEVMGSSETNMPQTTNFSKLQHQGSSTPLDPKPKQRSRITTDESATSTMSLTKTQSSEESSLSLDISKLNLDDEEPDMDEDEDEDGEDEEEDEEEDEDDNDDDNDDDDDNEEEDEEDEKKHDTSIAIKQGWYGESWRLNPPRSKSGKKQRNSKEPFYMILRGKTGIDDLKISGIYYFSRSNSERRPEHGNHLCHYVGQSEVVQRRIYEHFNGKISVKFDKCLRWEDPSNHADTWTLHVWPVPIEELNDEESKLIDALKMIKNGHNRKKGNKSKSFGTSQLS